MIETEGVKTFSGAWMTVLSTCGTVDLGIFHRLCAGSNPPLI